MHKRTWKALGTQFSLSMWDELSPEASAILMDDVETMTHDFDALYSRFKEDSLITKLSRETGTVSVPTDLVAMLRRYEVLFAATGGKINPCIGFALEDAGYDRTYSLVPKTAIRPVPRMNDAILIVNDTHLTLREPVLIDLGALGKGYLVDMLYDFLRARGVGRFLVDGSGDVRYFDVAATKITCALEDPRDATKAIGTLAMTEGALCASATNRRRWGAYHHYLDPVRVASPETIVATWVYASTATLADSLSSALFFVPPEALSAFSFEYLVVNHEFRIKKSAGFNALMFS